MKLPGVFDVKVLDNGTVGLTQRRVEQPTGDELAARLYGEQGFVVVQCTVRLAIGEIVPAQKWNNFRANPTCPVRVTAESSPEEFQAQQRLIKSLGGYTACLSDEYPYFYRVEAAD